MKAKLPVVLGLLAMTLGGGLAACTSTNSANNDHNTQTQQSNPGKSGDTAKKLSPPPQPSQ